MRAIFVVCSLVVFLGDSAFSAAPRRYIQCDRDSRDAVTSDDDDTVERGEVCFDSTTLTPGMGVVVVPIAALQLPAERECLDCKSFLEQGNTGDYCFDCQELYQQQGVFEGQARQAASHVSFRFGGPVASLSGGTQLAVRQCIDCSIDLCEENIHGYCIECEAAIDDARIFEQHPLAVMGAPRGFQLGDLLVQSQREIGRKRQAEIGHRYNRRSSSTSGQRRAPDNGCEICGSGIKDCLCSSSGLASIFRHDHVEGFNQDNLALPSFDDSAQSSQDIQRACIVCGRYFLERCSRGHEVHWISSTGEIAKIQ